jgi:hypothetical protein
MKCGVLSKNVRPPIVPIAVPLTIAITYAFWQSNITLNGSLRSSAGRVKGFLMWSLDVWVSIHKTSVLNDIPPVRRSLDESHPGRRPSPKLLRRKLRTLDQRSQLGLHEGGKAAVRAGNHVLASDGLGKADDPMGHQLPMLD